MFEYILVLQFAGFYKKIKKINICTFLQENTYRETRSFLLETENKVNESLAFMRMLLQEMRQTSVEYIQYNYGDQLTNLAEHYL